MKKQNIITALIILIAVIITSVFLSACGDSSGDIPNGKYTFYSISFGNSSIDKTDTLETVKEKLLIEFPQLEVEWNTWHNRPQIDITSEAFLERTATTDFFNITGDKWKINVYNMHYDFDDGQPYRESNEKYRLSGIMIETRRFFTHNEFGYRWIGTECNYDAETIYYEWWGAKVNFKIV